jgi:polyisoprenoid-binding protein YceI
MMMKPNQLLMPRRALAGAALPMLGLAPLPVRAARVFRFDQSQGKLEFIARHLMVLTSTGQFSRFDCELILDPERPETARVAVQVETGSITHAYPGAADLLRSAAYFDAERWPLARFSGRAAPGGRIEAFDLAGPLEMRGVTQPFTLQAKLARWHGRRYGGHGGSRAIGGIGQSGDWIGQCKRRGRRRKGACIGPWRPWFLSISCWRW